MKKIGFIGLGTMGLPIATNMITAGYDLFIRDLSRAPVEILVEKGATECSSGKEVAEQSEVVFIIVPNDKNVEDALFGECGLSEGLKAGSSVIDMSTIDLIRSREFAERLRLIGVNFLDAPVSGGPSGAVAATLSIMVGGDEAVFDSIKEVLQSIGKSVIYCGPCGLGLAAKMANNLIASAQMVAISEALCLAIKAGICPDALYEVLKTATANSTILNMKVPAYLKNNYDPGFKLALMCKDLNIITNVAKRLGTPTLVGSLVEQVYNMCKEEHGEKDSGAVSLFYQEQANVSFKSKINS